MDFSLFIPITLFICVVAAIKIVAETRLRRRLAETHASEELVKGILQADEQARRLSALKWGLVLVLVGLAFGLIDWLGLDHESPGMYGLLLGAAGLGMLGYHLASLRAR